MTSLAPRIVERDPQDTIAVRGEVTAAELPAFFARAFQLVDEAAATAGVEIVGPPFGLYPRLPSETVVVEAGFAVSAPAAPQGEAHYLRLPGGRAVEIVHVGPYDTMEDTYALLQTWMTEQGLHPAPGVWECYLSDPGVEPDPADWRTLIVWPLIDTDSASVQTDPAA